MGLFDRFKKNKENFIEETGREEKKFETIEPVNNSYEALIKEYEKMNIEQPGKYPLTFDECVNGLKTLFSKENYINAPKEKQIKIALLLMKNSYPLMKYYNAFKSCNMELLNNALFETAQLMQISNITSPGTDHGYYGMNITQNLLAANMMERIKLVLPEENGLSTGIYSGAHIANLLMAIIYDNLKFKERALVLSEKELTKKIPEHVKCWIKCMRAILLKDCEQFNEQLTLFCENYTKSKEYGMNNFNRKFCVEAHGIYNLAMWAYNGELKNNIAIPQVSNFCKDLAEFQEKNNFSMGRIVYIYPDNMDIFNKLLFCEPPKMFLKTDGKERVIDVDRFAQDIMKIILGEE